MTGHIIYDAINLLKTVIEDVMKAKVGRIKSKIDNNINPRS